MTLEEVIFAKEITVGVIRESGGELIIQLASASGKVIIKDNIGMELLKVDKDSNNKARLFLGGREVFK